MLTSYRVQERVFGFQIAEEIGDWKKLNKGQLAFCIQ
jgi:hypothetical protein